MRVIEKVRNAVVNLLFLSIFRNFVLFSVFMRLLRDGKIVLKKDFVKIADFLNEDEKRFLKYLERVGKIKVHKNHIIIKNLLFRLIVRSPPFRIWSGYYGILFEDSKVIRDQPIVDGTGEFAESYISKNVIKFLHSAGITRIDRIADFGSGDCRLLIKLIKNLGINSAYAIDISFDAINECLKNVDVYGVKSNVKIIRQDIRNIDDIIKKIGRVDLLISFFVFHEINRNEFLNVLKRIRKNRFAKFILIGEYVLSNHLEKKYPEYILLHEVKGKKLFSIKEIKKIIDASRMKIVKERYYTDLNLYLILVKV